ncbi:MAG: hypothetical protein U1D30_21520 [Planctomycetota bacterium]
MGASVSKRQSAGRRSTGGGGSSTPGRVLILLVTISLALLKVSRDDARPVREGIEWTLTPGVKAVRWAEDQTQQLLRKTRWGLPPAETLGHRGADEEGVRR